MKLNIRGEKIKITEAIKNYINEKMGKLNKYFKNDQNINAKVVIKVKGREQIIEVTINMPNFILRAEESHSTLYAAIDLVINKLERQIKKTKTKLQDKHLKHFAEDFQFDNDKNEEEEPIAKIVKRKVIEMKPMSEEEAILQMDLLGHSFFIYKDVDTNNICVLYKRKDNQYGVITTE